MASHRLAVTRTAALRAGLGVEPFSIPVIAPVHLLPPRRRLQIVQQILGLTWAEGVQVAGFQAL